MALPEAVKSWSKQHAYACVIVGLVIAGAIAYFALTKKTPARPQTSTPTLASDLAMSAAVEHLQTAAQAHRPPDARLAPLLEKLKNSPNDSTLLAEVADGYYQLHDFPHAADYYQRSLGAKDDPKVRVKLGGVYFYSGDADKAIGEFQWVLKTDPANADALFNLGMARWQAKGDADGAIAAWRQLLKTNPNHPRRAEVEKLIAVVSEHAGVSSATNAQGPQI